jgi:hypothetical protein
VLISLSFGIFYPFGEVGGSSVLYLECLGLEKEVVKLFREEFTLSC